MPADQREVYLMKLPMKWDLQECDSYEKNIKLDHYRTIKRYHWQIITDEQAIQTDRSYTNQMYIYV